MFTIRVLTAENPAAIGRVDGGNGWNADPQLWERYIVDQASGRRTVFVAWNGSEPLGYVTIDWASEYDAFAAEGTPEINNLSVCTDRRGMGIATALVECCEDAARRNGKTAIGIGVGLYPDYGSAQRLYSRLGYAPDGLGVTYRGKRLAPGARVRLDDDLVYWLSKRL